MDDLDLHDLATENLVLLSQLDQEEFVLQEIGRDTYVQTILCLYQKIFWAFETSCISLIQLKSFLFKVYKLI